MSAAPTNLWRCHDRFPVRRFMSGVYAAQACINTAKQRLAHSIFILGIVRQRADLRTADR
jgi:hypothetical protein